MFLLTLNALGGHTFYDAPYATAAVTQSRWGAQLIIWVASVLLFETLVESMTIRIQRVSYTTENFEWVESKIKETREAALDETELLPSFIRNVTLLTQDAGEAQAGISDDGIHGWGSYTAITGFDGPHKG